MPSHQAIFNTGAALIQVAIGFGILYKRTTKPAILVSFACALCVWRFGEAFGMLFMNMAMPLTGAPGAVLLYALIGAIVWPNDRPCGLLGVRGARTAWAALWLLMAWLWLLAPSSSANAIHNAINAAPSGMSWLSSSVQNGFASITKGNGLVFAIVLSALSTAIAIAVAVNWRAKLGSGRAARSVGALLSWWCDVGRAWWPGERRSRSARSTRTVMRALGVGSARCGSSPRGWGCRAAVGRRW